MRRHLVAVVTGVIIAVTAACSGGNNHESIPSTPPAFTPSEGAESTQDSDKRIVDVINPCALVTPNDLREITGHDYFPMGMTPAVDQTAREHSCHYGSPEPALRVTTLLDSAKGTPHWNQYVKDHETDAFIVVGGVGDAAFLNHDVFLAARSGRVIVVLERATPGANTLLIGEGTKLVERALERAKSAQ